MEVLGLDAGEDRAEQDQERRVVDPEEQDHHGGRGSVRRGELASPEVEADRPFAHREQEGRQDGSRPDVAPGDLDVGKNAVEHREENGHEDVGDERVRRFEDRGRQIQIALGVVLQRLDRGGEHERDDEDEAQRQDQSERDDPLPQELLDQRARLRSHVPHEIEGILELDEHGEGTDHEGADPDDAGQAPGRLERRASEHRVDGQRLLVSHQKLELTDDLLTHRARLEEQPGAGGEQNQHRREGEEREKGQGRALREGVALEPRAEGLAQDRAPQTRPRRDAGPAHRADVIGESRDRSPR